MPADSPADHQVTRRRFLGYGGTGVAVAALGPLSGPAASAETDAGNHAPGAPRALTVADQARPLNVQEAPSFGWLPQDVDRNEAQLAYQVKVFRGNPGSPAKPAHQTHTQQLVWDSGRVDSARQSYVPYDGPALEPATRFRWTVRTWDSAGAASAWAPLTEFGTGLRDRDWEAAWIRRRSSAEDEYTYARREFTIDNSDVAQARIYVAAFHKYELRINGQVVDRGPSFHYPDRGYYRALDVANLLAPGEKVAVGLLYHWHGAGQGRPEAAPGMLLRMVVDHADGSRQTLVSDGSWRVAQGPWLPAPRRNGDGGDYVEHIDGRAVPYGWDEPDFDDSAWQRPEVLGRHPVEPFPRLQPGYTSLRESPLRPKLVTTLPSGAVVADFGKVVPARPVVHFSRGSSGRKVAMLAGYLLDEDGNVSPEQGNQSTDMSYFYTQRDGEQEFRAFTYLGFRYFQIDNPGEDLDTDAISAIVQHAEFHQAAEFTSSDETLDAVFDLAGRSALYSAQEQFVDTPTREKGQFLADSINHSLVTMLAHGQWQQTRQAIHEFMDSQRRFWPDGRLNAVYPNGDGKRDIPDYTEQFPLWAWEYYLSTGDLALLADAYPVMVAVSDYVNRHIDADTGLVTKLSGGSGPYLHGIVDWPERMRFGYDMDTDARTTVNAWAVSALRNTANAAEALGKPGTESGRLRDGEAALAGAINARLRRSDGIYVDGLRGGQRSDHASQHANAFPLAFGITPRGERDAPADYLASGFDGLRMGPMTAHWLLRALAETGRHKQLLERITDTHGLGWANILARGGTFTWESWYAPEEDVSLSHGWGATVLLEIVRTVLGFTITGPAAATIRVRPPRELLDRAAGSLPTQRGTVDIDWWQARRQTSLDVDVPVNVQGEIHVPARSPEEVRIVGHGPGATGARFLREEEGYVVYLVGSGRTSFRAHA